MTVVSQEVLGSAKACIKDYFALDDGPDARLNRVDKLVGVLAAATALGGNGDVAVDAVRQATGPQDAVRRFVAELEIK